MIHSYQDEYNKLVHVSHGGDDIKMELASSVILVIQSFLVREVDEDSFYNTHLLSYIQSCVDLKVEPLRIYFNAQNPNLS